MSISFVSTVYKDINQGGASQLIGVAGESRYHPIDESFLSSVGFDAVASSTVLTPPMAGFSNIVFLDNGDVSGSFCQVSTSSVDRFANLTDYNFNDKTRSIIAYLSGEGSELRLSFRDTFLSTWDTMLDAELGSQASRKGDPVMIWEMFPPNISGLDPDLTYLKIQQQLNVNIPDWFDYDAWIKYHIFLFLDDANRIQGFCRRWEYWVESGIKSHRIAEQLEPKVIAGASTLTSQLQASIGGKGPFRTLYYIPGRQTGPSFSGVVTGSTTDDVTIVLGL